ncbi:PadR family transcriptional regulator [Acinetobacter sp. HR7]|uniref:PadR family transcriptional regulator n=1 Tax=Acinetobacter sp. HR7 TaxID=1509403 RepID=UPI000556D8D1|nr:PadR family transcriptional regulator [Acinetobacter sp. HR7]
MSKAPDSVLTEERESSPKPRKRLFEAGHMKLLVLYLISLAPKFGYDIIKEIGDIVGGGYSPSTGTIYPTLNYLLEQQYIHEEITPNERKRYSITAQGIEHLKAKQDCVANILGRFETRRRIQEDERYIDINTAMENLKAALRLKLSNSEISIAEIQKIADQIEQAATNIAHL